MLVVIPLLYLPIERIWDLDDLDAPVVRLGAHDVPIPFNETLERETVPTVERIVEAIQKIA